MITGLIFKIEMAEVSAYTFLSWYTAEWLIMPCYRLAYYSLMIFSISFMSFSTGSK